MAASSNLGKLVRIALMYTTYNVAATVGVVLFQLPTLFQMPGGRYKLLHKLLHKLPSQLLLEVLRASSLLVLALVWLYYLARGLDTPRRLWSSLNGGDAPDGPAPLLVDALVHLGPVLVLGLPALELMHQSLPIAALLIMAYYTIIQATVGIQQVYMPNTDTVLTDRLIYVLLPAAVGFCFLLRHKS